MTTRVDLVRLSADLDAEIIRIQEEIAYQERQLALVQDCAAVVKEVWAFHHASTMPEYIHSPGYEGED